MSTEIWLLENDLCRCCHAEGNFDNLAILQTNLKGVEIYTDMLKDCLNIEISPVPGELCFMTHKICKACIKKLRNASNFCKQVKQCEEKFLDMFRKKRIKAKYSSTNIDVKTEEPDVVVLKNELEEKEEIECIPAIEDGFHMNNDSDDEIENGTLHHTVKIQQFSYTDQESSDDDISLHLTSKRKKRIGDEVLKDVKKLDKKSVNKEKTKRPKNSSISIDVKIEEQEDNVIVLKYEEDMKDRGDRTQVEDGFHINEDFHIKDDSDNEKDKYDPLMEKSLLHINRNLQDFSFTDRESSDGDTGSNISSKVEKQKGVNALKKARTTHKNICKQEISQQRSVFRLQRKDYRKEAEKLICKHCDKVYFKIGSLRSHVQRKHYNYIPTFKCHICEKQYTSLAKLTVHKYTEHNIDDRFKCNACEGAFNDKVVLRRHIDIYHMMGKKFKCKFCDYESFTKEGMHKHKYKHRTAKDYHCKFCPKAFVRKSNMTLHEKIHTGERSKVCQVCGQAFVQKASLNYHMAKYHPEVDL